MTKHPRESARVASGAANEQKPLYTAAALWDQLRQDALVADDDEEHAKEQRVTSPRVELVWKRGRLIATFRRGDIEKTAVLPRKVLASLGRRRSREH